jgi:hypothetical protein
MANRFVLPLETPVDETGAPYPGGQLFFYQNLTTTKLNTYSDAGLTIANPNPVVLDSAGRFPNAIFLQNVPYTVVFAPATDSDPPTSPIWTQNNVYTSDYSTVAKFRSGSGSPNGTVAGTAGSATISADVYWDYTNNILYVCTTTGSASTAVWTAVNASTAAAVVVPPQGRLTLTSGVPVLNGDVSAATAVYFTPYIGNICPIYNGATMVPTNFSELQLTLVSAHTASNIYDVFMFSNSGVPTIVTGPSWSSGTGGSITAGSCARGTGTGGTALSYVNGILTNTAQITGRNGNTTYTINANLATYLGSLFMDGTNGQISCLIGYGQSRKWGVWNAYNRDPIRLKAGDGTATWTYSNATVRASNGNAANSLTIFSGLAEETYDIRFVQRIDQTSNAASAGLASNAIGFNWVSGAGTGKTGFVGNTPGSSDSQKIVNDGNASYQAAPSLGINTVTALESTPTVGNTCVWNGTEAAMLLSAIWRG